MGNTQGVWKLYGALMTLNVLKTKNAIAAERHRTMRIDKLNQSISF